MKFAITGGRGFLGSFLTKDLLGQFPDSTVLVLDRVPPVQGGVSASDPRVYQDDSRDITNYSDMENAFDGIDTVIHTAGLVSFSQRDRDALYRVNVDGTECVLNAAMASGVGRVVHVSSVAALGYADSDTKLVDESFEFDWQSAEKRNKHYMLSKHSADERVAHYRSLGLDCMVAYPGLMLGPGDRKNSLKFIDAIHKGKIPFNMPGGTNIVDVRDVSRGLVSMLENGTPNAEYLLSGVNLSFKEINQTIADIVDGSSPKITIPRFLNGIFYYVFDVVEKFHPGEVSPTADNVDSSFKLRYFSNAKALKELGWSPQIPLEDTIGDIFSWAKETGEL
jgi:dihydroflavonol-4-reductase